MKILDNAFFMDLVVDPQGAEQSLSDETLEFLAATGLLGTPKTVLKKLKQGMIKKLLKGWMGDSWFLTKEATTISPLDKKPTKRALQVKVLRMLSLLLLGASEDHDQETQALYCAWGRDNTLTRAIANELSANYFKVFEWAFFRLVESNLV